MLCEQRPKIRVFQTADTDLSQRMVSANSFGLQWMMQKRIERAMTWPIREEDNSASLHTSRLPC